MRLVRDLGHKAYDVETTTMRLSVMAKLSNGYVVTRYTYTDTWQHIYRYEVVKLNMLADDLSKTINF